MASERVYPGTIPLYMLKKFQVVATLVRRVGDLATKCFQFGRLIEGSLHRRSGLLEDWVQA